MIISALSQLTSRDYYTTAAMLTTPELEAILIKTKVGAVTKLKLRSALLIMRSAAGIPDSSLAVEPPSAPTPPLAGGATVVVSTAAHAAASLKPGEVTSREMVALNDIVDQGSKLEVKILDTTTLDTARARYRDSEKGDPPEDENPTKEQLTALFAAVFTLITTFADFAVWVPRWRRLAKKRRFTAMTINEFGEYVTAELLGPGSFQLWEGCWNVFRTACMMLNLVANGLLRRYATMIKAAALKYPLLGYHIPSRRAHAFRTHATYIGQAQGYARCKENHACGL